MQNQPKQILSSILLVISLFAPTGYASEQEGHGGGALICQYEGGYKAIMLDLWEGQLEKPFGLGLVMKNSKGMTVDDIVTRALKKLPGGIVGFGGDTKAALEIVKSNLIFLPIGLDIYDSDDVKAKIIPSNCEFKFAARFQNEIDGPRIYVNKMVWESMDDLNKAALLLHEAIYKVLRDRVEDSDSKRTRVIVANLLSNIEFENIYAEIPIDDAYYCTSTNKDLPSWAVYLTETNSRYDLQLITIAGNPVLSKKTVAIDKSRIQNLDFGSPYFYPQFRTVSSIEPGDRVSLTSFNKTENGYNLGLSIEASNTFSPKNLFSKLSCQKTKL